MPDEEAPPFVPPTETVVRLTTLAPAKKACGTFVPKVVVWPGPTEISGVNPTFAAELAPVEPVVIEMLSTTAPAGRITGAVLVEDTATFAVAAELFAM